MALDALLLSQDQDFVRLYKRVFEGAGITAHVSAAAGDADQQLQRSKFDAVVIDLDEVSTAADVLRGLRQGRANRRAIVFAILHGKTSVKEAYDLGANFVLEKPISGERLTRSLRAAYGLIVRERRRYYRHKVDSRLYLSGDKSPEVNAIVLDISEGGLHAQVPAKHDLGGSIKLRFTVPGTSTWVEGFGEVTWRRQDGRIGVQFTQLSLLGRRELDQWLLAAHEEHEKREKQKAQKLAGAKR